MAPAGVDVVTYIQSGNVIFQHKEGQATSLSQTISQAVLNRFHFAPYVVLMTAKHLKSALVVNPFPAAIEDPKTLHLHAPDGIGRSKLAARAEKLLGVPATGRNWRTAQKVVELVG